MKNVRLGRTEIIVTQNAFGCLPIQRDTKEVAVKLLREAYEGGMRFFDTARAYTDSEEKVGEAFDGIRDKIYIATKTAAKTPEGFWKDLETSLKNLRTDYIDIYQLHMVPQCYRPGDGTGMYECLEQAKEKGLIRHIGITTHKLAVAQEIIESGLYEPLQYPFSYLSSEKEIALVRACVEKDMGFICMKALAGGLVTRSDAAMAYMTQFDNLVPIWGIQRENELREWLSYMENTPSMTDEITAFIKGEQDELAGEFCRGCGYCLPCAAGIEIPTAARMNMLLRRAPYQDYITDEWHAKMQKINDCIHCDACKSRCPYHLDTPALLQYMLKDYNEFYAAHKG